MEMYFSPLRVLVCTVARIFAVFPYNHEYIAGFLRNCVKATLDYIQLAVSYGPNLSTL